ncbi:MAG TPA: DUF5011 domain-containing protein, partial [Sulfurimonas sp.]|nr:DUF5011 domain-containing protein [Sulfurimonas sp.]
APKVVINNLSAFKKSNIKIIADIIDMKIIKLENRADLTIEPFTEDTDVAMRIEKLKLKKASVLLNNGLYHIKRVELKNRSSLSVGDNVQIVNRRTVVLNHSRINASKNTAICDDEHNANALFIYSTDLVRVENHSKIVAMVYNNRRVEFTKHSGLKGSISAKNRAIFKNHSKVCYTKCNLTSTSTDITPPVLTLNGSDNITLQVGNTYNELGATALDNVDGNLSVSISGSVDTDTVEVYTLTYSATDNSNNEANITRIVNVVLAPDVTAPIITLNGESNVTLTQGSEYIELGASAVDDRDGNVSVSVSGNVNTTIVGIYTITYTATDSANNSASKIRTVNIKEIPRTLTSLVLSPNIMALRVGNSLQVSLEGIYDDGSRKTLTENIAYAVGDSTLVSIDEFGLLLGNSVGTTNLRATVGNINSPIIEVKVVGELNTTNFNFTNFGTKYIDNIPVDATVDAYDEKRFCMIAGQILGEDDVPLVGVKVSILNHTEYGSTLTDSNGSYVIPSEGGLQLTMRYQKNAYTTVDRNIQAPVQDWVRTPTVTLLEIDSKVTSIDLTELTAQVHISTPINDDRGERSSTLVFDGVTKAIVTAKDGSTRELSNIAVRATEFKTPASMPSDLPTNSAYTYCSDLTVDGVLDDENVTFDAPVIMYVDNFLGFDVGEIVPIGYYDRSDGKWKASKNGVVVKLLDTNNDGTIDALDSTGDDIPNDLNGDGGFEDEVSGIVNNGNYTAGKTYWRAEITHFTPWDHNWPYGPPLDAVNPEEPDIKEDSDEPNDCQVDVSSYVTSKSRVFHEDIPVAGTDITLHYSSKRVDGYKYVIDASINAEALPSSIVGATVTMEVAGKVFSKNVNLGELNKLTFEWDGKDTLGNLVSGEVKAKVTTTYKYNLVYYRASSSFSQAWNRAGTESMNVIGRNKVDYSSSKIISLNVESNNNAKVANGWAIAAQSYAQLYIKGIVDIFDGKKYIEQKNGLLFMVDNEPNKRFSYFPIEQNRYYSLGVSYPSANLGSSGNKVYLKSFTFDNATVANVSNILLGTYSQFDFSTTTVNRPSYGYDAYAYYRGTIYEGLSDRSYFDASQSILELKNKVRSRNTEDNPYMFAT